MFVRVGSEDAIVILSVSWSCRMSAVRWWRSCLRWWWCRLPSTSSKIFEHRGCMSWQHLAKISGHGVWPKEVVIQSTIRIHSFAGIQNQQFVQQIQSVRILDVRFQTFLHFPLLAFGKIQFIEQFKFVDSGPDFGWYWTTQLADENGLILFTATLHDGTASPQFSHYTSGTPQIHRWAIISFSKQKFGWPVP